MEKKKIGFRGPKNVVFPVKTRKHENLNKVILPPLRSQEEFLKRRARRKWRKAERILLFTAIFSRHWEGGLVGQYSVQIAELSFVREPTASTGGGPIQFSDSVGSPPNLSGKLHFHRYLLIPHPPT